MDDGHEYQYPNIKAGSVESGTLGISSSLFNNVCLILQHWNCLFSFKLISEKRLQVFLWLSFLFENPRCKYEKNLYN